MNDLDVNDTIGAVAAPNVSEDEPRDEPTRSGKKRPSLAARSTCLTHPCG